MKTDRRAVYGADFRGVIRWRCLERHFGPISATGRIQFSEEIACQIARAIFLPPIADGSIGFA